MYLSMVDTSVDFGTAPMTVSHLTPFLKIITVGMERMPYSVATLGDSSVFSFTCKCSVRGPAQGGCSAAPRGAPQERTGYLAAPQRRPRRTPHASPRRRWAQARRGAAGQGGAAAAPPGVLAAVGSLLLRVRVPTQQ